MKLVALFSITFLLIVNTTENSGSHTFNEHEYIGIWVPFEVVYQDGDVDKGPFTHRNIFGVYDESLQLKEGNIYYPVNWVDENNYRTSPEESGKYIVSDSKLLLSEGTWDMEFEIVKLENEELWLKYWGESNLFRGYQPTYKIKRKIK